VWLWAMYEVAPLLSAHEAPEAWVTLACCANQLKTFSYKTQ
jgi:hypothetical protein